eukprot:scaffold3_cov389-Prasinococcus_capsulatus_cf.AAC.26
MAKKCCLSYLSLRRTRKRGPTCRRCATVCGERLPIASGWKWVGDPNPNQTLGAPRPIGPPGQMPLPAGPRRPMPSEAESMKGNLIRERMPHTDERGSVRACQ